MHFSFDRSNFGLKIGEKCLSFELPILSVFKCREYQMMPWLQCHIHIHFEFSAQQCGREREKTVSPTCSYLITTIQIEFDCQPSQVEE
jgi:hypothetical protein